MKRKPTIMLLLISILYGSIIFFLMGIVLRLIINFIYLKNFSMDEQDIFKAGVLSIIAGTAGGTGSWIFAKIDERKTSKSPPSDRE
ncbi:hypothetical protein WB67_00250 [bacteria symbiont BFo2 of Frankliniella occidentalis]|nr:hypothetical protein WB60_04145 [bacteria symbiont BFo2 of Frankliniella occidentalis]KYP96930.1 hypothetical protein WB67_00250 [bacteria symbiont BFo2 of Frankliniella occidentalis]